MALAPLPASPPGDSGGDDATIVLRRDLLVARLDQLRDSTDLAVLRVRVRALKEEVSTPGGALHAAGGVGEGEVVMFASWHLHGDLDQIAGALTADRARYYVERLLRGVSEVRTSAINDINLNRWKEYGDIITDSLWLIERRDSSGAHRADYWGNFVPQIPAQLMRRYTRPGEWVLDAFAGLGTTLIEGQRLGRNVLGVELQQAVAERARLLVAQEPNPAGVVAAMTVGDSSTLDVRALLEHHGCSAVQLALLHPPYFDIIRFSDDPRDLSNAASVDDFLAMLGRCVAAVATVLDGGRYLALVIGDKYVRGEWVPLGFLAMNEVLRHGFVLKSIVVKNFDSTAGKRQQQELWRYRALVGGFYIFKHEYIFLFRKR